jgi:hypothetical protein
MEIIIAVSIAVTGWLVNHILSLRAQRKSFLNNILNNARSEISKSIQNYIDWLNELVQHNGNLLIVKEFPFGRENLEKDYSIHLQELRKTVKKIFLDPQFITKLGEYESLIPETKEIRNYLRKKHIELYLNLESNSVKEDKFDIDYERYVELVDNLKFELVGAQQIAVRDLLICIQNLTLGKITNNFQEPILYPMMKHPRVIIEKKNKLKIVEFGDKDYPENKSIEYSNIYK